MSHATRLRGFRAGMPAFRAGLIFLVLAVVGTYFTFTKSLPFRSHYEIRAVFATANNLKPRAPVRTAGVDIGKVVSVEHLRPGEEAAVVTLRIEDDGRPIHRDARLKIRPRLFLEGNFFVDLQPGTPHADEVPDGGTIPIQQTASPVQLAQVLSALQSDTRRHLQILLDEYSTALEAEGARGYRRSIPHWAPAYRNSALVNQATLGFDRHDLSNYLDGAGRVARGLDRSPERLRSLITDFDTAAGAFAREASSLERAIAELPRTLRAAQPALAALSDALPSLRRFARDLEPSVRESGETIDVALAFLRQARGLVSRRELRGLVADLVPTVPRLVRLSDRTIPLYSQVRLASSCENEVILPWSSDRLEDPSFPATGPVYEEGVKWLPGLAGESRSGDANGQWFRSLTAAGDRTVALGDGRFAQVSSPILGTNPPKAPAIPAFRPDVPCETQERPDLRTRPGPAPPEVGRGLSGPGAQRRYDRARLTAVRWLRRQLEREELDRLLSVTTREATRDEVTGGGGEP